jgi:hypothetical protein
MLQLILDRPTTAAEPVSLGPFDRIQIGHRRLVAGELKLLRHFDGGWHWNGRSYLEARINPVGLADRVMVDFVRAWAATSPGEQGDAARLLAGRLYIDHDDRWVATDDDDGRCWIAEATGLASAEVTLKAA